MSSASPVPSSRSLAAGVGFRVSEFVCSAGPLDRPFEEQHASFAISAVVDGTFTLRTDVGRALLHPGALMLGNRGACFECGHTHAAGDRCVAVHYDAELFEEIAASAAEPSGARFTAPMVPASGALTPLVAALEALARGGDPERADALALRLAEDVLSLLSGGAPRAVAPTPAEHRRIDAVLRYVEARSDDPLDLDSLARVARMSKYHFARCFRRITGASPYDYLLGVRLRRAAARLRESDAPVAAVAHGAGFGDLSTFHARFRRVFGATPAAWRAAR